MFSLLAEYFNIILKLGDLTNQIVFIIFFSLLVTQILFCNDLTVEKLANELICMYMYRTLV